MFNLTMLRRLWSAMVLIAAVASGTAQATPLVQFDVPVDIAGAFDNDERGAASNVIWDIYVGANASITSLRWELNLTSYPGSYLSEMQLTFSDTLGNGVTFTPGDVDDEDGTMDYAGFQDLADIGQIFNLGSDGVLRLEFHDFYKDLAFDEPEGVWNAGTVTFGVTAIPEPSTMATMLGALLLLSAVVKRRES